MQQNSILNVDREKLSLVQGAEVALKALKKAEAYLTLFNKLDTGVEFSENVIKDIQVRQRAVQHRIDVLRAIEKAA